MYSKTKFFLGANSHTGFISYFKQLQEQNSSMQLLILKGGPGSGKSSLMKRVADFAESKGHKLEIIPCASDPDSLDAVIDLSANFAIMDGTAPHTEDPSLPGALHHIMYTGDLWDCAELGRHKDNIEKLTASISDCHKNAGSYIKSAAALLSENLRYSRIHLDKKAASEFAQSVTSCFSGGNYGKEKRRLLSAVSVGEVKLFSETVSAFADKIYVIEDQWGGAADYIMQAIYDAAMLCGEPVIVCPCSVMPEKYDHLIFPQSRVAVVTQNSFLRFPFGEKTDADRFYTDMALTVHMQQRLSDSKKLISKAASAVSDAKFLHDELEAFYIDAMDFSRMDEFLDEIIERFYM